jgi:hypothetical protein
VEEDTELMKQGVDETSARKRKWTTDEDNKLKDAVDDTLTGSPDDVVAVAPPDAVTAVVAAFLPKTRASRSRPHKRTPNEDAKLTATVTELGTSDWIQIAVMVPDRMNIQCRQRWITSLDPTGINRGKWTVKEDTKLMKQGVVETTARVGKWTTDEDSKLKDAVAKHNGKNWFATAALVPGRTHTQCWKRWHNVLYSKSDETTARAGKWTADEDSKLEDAVKKHNGKKWADIAALVADRSAKQCYSRWHDTLVHCKSGETTARKGYWTRYEDSTLIDAVEKHNGKNWDAIAALVPRGKTVLA